MSRFTRTLTFLGLLPCLSGCFLDKMHDVTEQTKNFVKATNEKMDETRDGAALTAGLSNMGNRSLSENLRTASAETVFIKGPEDRVGKYVGAPGPIQMPTVPKKISGKYVDLPNVTYVVKRSSRLLKLPFAADLEVSVSRKESRRTLHQLNLSPVDEDLFEILQFAARNMLGDLNTVSLKAGLTAEQRDEYGKKARRMVLVATAILGALDADEVAKLVQPRTETDDGLKAVREMTDRKRLRPYLISTAAREEAASELNRMAANYAFTEEEIVKMRNLVEDRLGVTGEL